jgi:hypothetical protein
VAIDTSRPRAMAEALTAPSAILLAGAGAAAAILAGAPAAVAALAGAACWAARVWSRLPKRAPAPRIEPARLAEPWRSFVRDALDAGARFDRAVRATRPGPLRDRLGEVGARIAAGIRECWAIAQRGDQLATAVRELGIDGIRRELAEAEAEARRHPGRPELEAAARSLREQLASAERRAGVARDTADRLRRLNAQLDEAVARAVELSLDVGDLSGLEPLGSSVESVVGELEALRQALDEAGASPRRAQTA